MTSLRDYRPEDIEHLWLIDRQCFVQGISYSRRELEFYIGLRGAFTLVAEDGDKDAIAGFLVAACSRTRMGSIVTIDVLPEYRRSGLGTTLMQAAEQRLRDAGCRAVKLEVAVDNAAALAFYKRHGYVVERALPRYYLDSIDGLRMSKRLAAEAASRG